MRTYKILSLSVVILLIAVVFVGVVPAAAQYDTMQYRYNAQHSGDYSPVAGPVPSNGQLKWSYTTGSYVSASPAVANGVVYVGGDDNPLRQQRHQALELRDRAGVLFFPRRRQRHRLRRGLGWKPVRPLCKQRHQAVELPDGKLRAFLSCRRQRHRLRGEP